MAVYKIFPEKDTTIYSLLPFMNTGVDEIVEATTTTFGIDVYPQTSRTLMKFSTTEINNVIDNTIGGLDELGDARLKLFIATVEGLNEDTEIEVYPISGSWNMGTGKYLDDPITTNGASWQWYDFSGSNKWEITDFTGIPKEFVTASMDPLGVGGGGNWWVTDPQSGISTEATQSINYSDTKDLNLAVSSSIKFWYSASKGLVRADKNEAGYPQIHNDGFIIKQSNANEFVYIEDKATELKYFSIDTNTIYPPQLELKWRDYTFNTGSSTTPIIDTTNLVVSLQENPGIFRKDSIYDFRLGVRPKFPARSFQTASIYLNNSYLPENSYYAVKDLDTNEFVIDFDTSYTQISADEESSLFRLYMNGLEPERYYQILIKTEVKGNTLLLDDKYYFKVING